MSLSPYSSRNPELPVGRLDLDENIRDGEHSWEHEQMRRDRWGWGRPAEGQLPTHSSEETLEGTATPC